MPNNFVAAVGDGEYCGGPWTRSGSPSAPCQNFAPVSFAMRLPQTHHDS